MEVRIADMDLAQITDSGQCFRMERLEDGGYRLIAGRRCLKLYQIGEKSPARFVFSCGEEEFREFWSVYFDLGRDYGAMRKRIDPQDAYLSRAVSRGWGIRILKQDLWEMIITFIISQQNNIPRIRRCVRLLCERYGECLEDEECGKYYAFPGAKCLANADLEALLACNLGYRAKYIQKTAQMIAEGRVSLEAVAAMPYEQARDELKKLCGVGIKVAECVCLFALHHVEAFPVDTHISQILAAHYPRGFPFGRYQGIAGILQQYMFYDELHGDKG